LLILVEFKKEENKMENTFPKMVTPEHKIFVKGKGWIMVKDLTEGDKQNIACITNESTNCIKGGG